MEVGYIKAGKFCISPSLTKPTLKDTLTVKPTYFQGSFPPENPGETSISTVGLDNGGVIKIYLNDLEQAEKLGNLIATAPALVEALRELCSEFESCPYPANSPFWDSLSGQRWLKAVKQARAALKLAGLI